jgi:hypothetical protein
MSKPSTTLTPFYGVSNYNCNNRKLFDFVETYQKTDKTVLEFRKRIEDDKVEEFVGLSIDVDEDGNINMLSLMFQQGVFDNDEHAQATNATPKIYFL